MALKKNWTVYLIHHSHTDIGYTERQEKLMRYHYDFIRQAIDILDQLHETKDKAHEGFVWQCENYWQVENFYKMADEVYKKKFEQYAASGEIGLSGNYLNLTELVTAPVLNNELDKMENFGKSIGHKITASMSADINGMAWGYADALYEHGIRSYFSCLHPHHGMFPLYKKVMPFYWESPKGNRLLVWNGDHYHLGNEMFLSPHGGTTYMVRDEFSKPLIDFDILNESAENTKAKEMEIAAIRIERYLENLENEGYPYSLVPLMVSGAITDNAPPNAEIAVRVHELNAHYNGRITFKMVNLEQFFEAVKAECDNIPVYSGDWTDWWADGVGSTPAEVKLYKEAARKYSLCEKLDKNRMFGDSGLMAKAADELMLYAEHTWGYSSSVSEPWESLVNVLGLKKSGYAINAHTHISENLDKILAAKGEVSILPDRGGLYKIVNPHDFSICTKAYLYVEYWEYMGGVRYSASMPMEVVDTATGERLKSQVKQISRAIQVEIEVALKAGEEKIVKICPVKKSYGTTMNHAHIGAEGVEDLIMPDVYREDTDMIETENLIVRMDSARGIYSITDKSSGKELIRETAQCGAFAGIYEVTDIKDGACETRRSMGRNRKANKTKRFEAKLCDRRIVENGAIYIAAALDYELAGTKMYTVFVKIYKHQPKLEAMVRIHKESCWAPENLYVAMPFTAGADSVLYTDKTGCIIRPGIDQLPGSCQDFYLIQNGVLWQSGSDGVAVITKDTPLITLGDLQAHPIRLCGSHDENQNGAPIYSWAMNNFWETNFKVDLGGFYEFAYTVLLLKNKTPEESFKLCEAENEGVPAFYIKPEK